MSRTLRNGALLVLGVFVLLYAGIVTFMYVNQRSLQYNTSGEIFELAPLGIPRAEAISFPSGDGTINGWYAPPQAGEPLIIFFRGNWGSFSAEHERFSAMAEDGYGFLSIDYRGFPMSPGAVSEAGILEDALATFDWAAAQGVPIAIWGRSLGTGPATYVASRRESEALILETPFTAAVDVGAQRYPFLPVAFTMQDQFRLRDWLPEVAEPVFVAHGTADTVIPVSHGERVFELAPDGRELWIEPGADHSGLWERGLWQRVKGFLDAELP